MKNYADWLSLTEVATNEHPALSEVKARINQLFDALKQKMAGQNEHCDILDKVYESLSLLEDRVGVIQAIDRAQASLLRLASQTMSGVPIDYGVAQPVNPMVLEPKIDKAPDTKITRARRTDLKPTPLADSPDNVKPTKKDLTNSPDNVKAPEKDLSNPPQWVRGNNGDAAHVQTIGQPPQSPGWLYGNDPEDPLVTHGFGGKEDKPDPYRFPVTLKDKEEEPSNEEEPEQHTADAARKIVKAKKKTERLEIQEVKKKIDELPEDMREMEVRSVLTTLLTKAFDKFSEDNEAAKEATTSIRLVGRNTRSETRRGLERLIKDFKGSAPLSDRLRREYLDLALHLAERFKLKDAVADVTALGATLDAAIRTHRDETNDKQKKTKDKMKRMRDMHDSGWSVEQIASQFDMTEPQVIKIMEKNPKYFPQKESRSFDDYLREPTFHASRVSRLLEGK